MSILNHMTEYQLLILKICKFENKRVMNENNLKKNYFVEPKTFKSH